jgi:hypothetical protein
MANSLQDKKSLALNVETKDILKTSVIFSKRRMVSKIGRIESQEELILHGRIMI